MLHLVSHRLEIETFSFLNRHKLICWTVYAVSTILFFLHAYATTVRFLQKDIQQIVTPFRNESLPMPLVKLQLDSLRKNLIDGNSLPKALMTFDFALDNEIIPAWAYVEVHALRQHYGLVNQIHLAGLKNFQEYENKNFTFDDAKKFWPLKSSVAEAGGIIIRGTFDATNFIGSGAEGEEQDYISAKVSSFETDSPSSSTIGLPNYQLLPCEELQIAISLEYYSLINRQGSPCRNDYPPELETLLKKPIAPQSLYNPVFAPDLPYDVETCKLMCSTKYWLPKCGCFPFPEIWRYAGKPANLTQCLPFGENSSQCFNPSTPSEIIKACHCFPKCVGYRFRVVAAEKIHHEEGISFRD